MKAIHDALIMRLKENILEELIDQVAAEIPFALMVNGKLLVTLVCTPTDLDAMAVGFLLSEGILTERESLLDLKQGGIALRPESHALSGGEGLVDGRVTEARDVEDVDRSADEVRRDEVLGVRIIRAPVRGRDVEGRWIVDGVVELALLEADEIHHEPDRLEVLRQGRRRFRHR